MSYVVEKMAKIQVTDHANQATTLGRNCFSFGQFEENALTN